MRFYNLITESTQDDLDRILMKMSMPEIEYIEKLYKNFKSVEYTDKTGMECMYIITDDNVKEKLEKLYNSHNIKFKMIDITHDIFFDNSIKTNYKNQYQKNVRIDIFNLAKKYKEDWTTSDIVLDKILEKGINSLTDFDYSVLNKV